MPARENKIVVDTNLWISFLIGKSARHFEELLLNSSVRIIYSDELLREIQDVLKRTKFRKYFPEDAVKSIESILIVAG
jgi:uncharacterized protein